MEDWLQGLFNAQTPSWGMGGSMSAAAPQITNTMMYPFLGGTPGGADTAFPEGPDFSSGAPVPSVSGGGLPSGPGPGASYASLATGGDKAASGGLGGFLNTLRGVKMPDAPVAQKVGTPHVAPQKAIQSGELINLMASLGITPRDVLQHPRIQVPGLR